jgi:hypothetical protein
MKVIETVTVPRIGTGSDTDPFRPDTNATAWRVIDELEMEFTIEILEL